MFIESGIAETALGVVVPDLPGCFSAGNTLDEALDAAREAAALWVDSALDAGSPIPPPSTLASVRHDPDDAAWILAVVELDPALFDDTIERVNVTLPKRALRRLDAQATAPMPTPGAFIADLTLRFARSDRA